MRAYRDFSAKAWERASRSLTPRCRRRRAPGCGPPWLDDSGCAPIRTGADCRRGLPPVITGEPPQALTLHRFRLQDGSAPDGSFEQIDLYAEYGGENRRAQFIFIAPRVALERPPHDAPAGDAGPR
jgi:hypothetical protein